MRSCAASPPAGNTVEMAGAAASALLAMLPVATARVPTVL